MELRKIPQHYFQASIASDTSPVRLNIRFQKIQSLSQFRCVDVPLLTFQGCGFENGKGTYNGHGGLSRTEPIIDPFSCLLNESVSSFGFCCKSINRSRHNESVKHPGFYIFNSSSGAPVKSGGASLYSKSNSMPAIAVHFCHVLSQRPETENRRSRTEAHPCICI